MTEPTITCPNCSTSIPLTESLAQPMVEATKRKFQEQLAAKDAEVAKRAAELDARDAAMRSQQSTLKLQQQELTQAKELMEQQVAAKVAAQVQASVLEQRKVIVAEEARKARESVALDMAQKSQEAKELQERLADRESKLVEAQKTHADALRMKRAAEDERKAIELTVEQRVTEQVTDARDKGRREAEELHKLKIKEMEEARAVMQRQIEELRRKAEQGSQQLQGEALEVALEQQLRDRFRHDAIEPVPKGEHGGDLLHRVRSPTGQMHGTILWESKNTKNWSDQWLAKLRDDVRTAKADVAIIVSTVLPKGTETFEHIEGVWVTTPRTVIPVAFALRQTLVEVANARQALVGQQDKMSLMYEYLMGPAFRHRIQAVVEAFTQMQEDLEAEKRAINKQWSKRAAQIDRVMQATTGMYGDLQGIAGSTLPEIEGMSVNLLEGPE